MTEQNITETGSSAGQLPRALPPLPELTDENREFWRATSAGDLRLQRCDRCGHIRYPVSFICPDCLSTEYTWDLMSGRGSVYSTVVFHQVYHPAFADKVPYNVALVELAEGPIMVSNVVGPDPAQVAVGDPVTVFFDQVTDEITIPRFRPDDGSRVTP